MLAKLVDAVDRGRRAAPLGGPGLTRVAAEGAVGAVLAVLHARLLARPPKPLVKLRGQLMSLIVLPYLGSAAAAAELARPAPRARVTRSPPEDPLRGLNMRLTYRTMRVLSAIAAGSGLSNRQVAREAEVEDQGQISKLLRRLSGLGLIETGSGVAKGEANAWILTARGMELERVLQARGTGSAG